MTRISIGRIWDEVWAFLRAESALWLPVALATIGTAMLVLTLVIPDPVDDRLPGGPWLLWLIPIYVLMLTGILAITTLVLRPGASVGESLTHAMRRLPAAAGVVLLTGAISLIVSVPVSIASAIDTQRSGAPGGLTAVVNAAMLVAMVWLWVRLLPMWAVIADRPATPLAALRESFGLTRGATGRLLALTLIVGAALAISGAALLFGAGAVLMIVGRAAGDPALGSLLVSILLATVAAVAAAIWTVVVACLYRHLLAARSA